MRAFLKCAALALLTTGCDRDGGSPIDPSQVNIEFTTTDLVVGTGAQAAVGNTATVNYTGWLYDGGGTESKGQQFDTSLQPGRTPLNVVIGLGVRIPGFEQGILGMRVGGKRRVYVPANLAYGSQGNPPIPSDAALVFEIDLVNLVQ